jgi:hypothetical protein
MGFVPFLMWKTLHDLHVAVDEPLKLGLWVLSAVWSSKSCILVISFLEEARLKKKINNNHGNLIIVILKSDY